MCKVEEEHTQNTLGMAVTIYHVKHNEITIAETRYESIAEIIAKMFNNMSPKDQDEMLQ